MSAWENIDQEDYEDLRIAVVMNGGVSLAIWIGGVARELNRLTESQNPANSAYADVLEVVKSKARIDVLAGTSAGGINAGFLALAFAYGTSLDSLANLWADCGAFGDLLRSPLDKDTPSLLKGDSYFYPKLKEAFEGLLSQPESRYRSAEGRPLDLTITTTLIKGEVERFVDDFGTEIRQLDHKGRFSFVRRDGEAPEDDPFHERDRIAGWLARASRSTASFPFAFEPSFVPVENGESSAWQPQPIFEKTLVNFAESRFALDGGVLMNMPVEPALEAIFKQPGEREVRRVLAYVNPDPGAVESPGADESPNPPAVGEVLANALVKLPAAQSISQDLRDIQENNQRAANSRRTRPDLLQTLGETSSRLADDLFPTYKRVRIARAINKVADLAVPQSGVSDRIPPAWTRTELIHAFEDPEPAPQPELPFIPKVLDLPMDGSWDWGLAPVERLRVVVTDILKRSLFIAPFDEPELRRSLRDARTELKPLWSTLSGLRSQDTEFWKKAASLPNPPKESKDRKERLRSWARDAASKWTDMLTASTTGAGVERYSMSQIGAVAFAITGVLVRILPVLWTTVGLSKLSVEPLIRAAGEELNQILITLFGSGTEQEDPQASKSTDLVDPIGWSSDFTPPMGDEERVYAFLRRILHVEVCIIALAGESLSVEQEVALMQLSANTPHSIGGPKTAKRKLDGVQLSHFGAFYKKSWRVNDWTWGRMDGALRLVEAVLSPRRLRQLGLHTSVGRQRLIAKAEEAGPVAGAAYRRAAEGVTVEEILRRAAIGVSVNEVPDAGGTPSHLSRQASAYLERTFNRDLPKMLQELSFLDDTELPVPPSVPFTASVIARRLYFEILSDEIGSLAAAVDYDIAAGALKNSPGTTFRDQYKTMKLESWNQAEGWDPEVLFDLFTKSAIGTETIEDEKLTDLFARTASRATAVTTSVIDSSRLGFVKTILRPIRAVTLILYSLVFGATEQSKFGPWLVNAVLATGGALLAVSLMTDEMPTSLKFLAGVVVVSGLALAALRGGLKKFAWVLAALLVAGIVVTGLIVGWENVWKDVAARSGAIITIVALIVLSMGLGSVRTKNAPSRHD